MKLMVDKQISANDRQVGGSHYKGEKPKKWQHWDIVDDYGVGYLEGNATKYVSRWRSKNGLQDLEKSLHYCDKLIENAKDKWRRPSGIVPFHVLREFYAENDFTGLEQNIMTMLFRWETIGDLETARRGVLQLISAAKEQQ